MADVAEVAGVSPQTVSRVVNESGYVGHVTRERVLAAMRELSYRPNSAARALVTGRSNTLGVISIDTTLFGPASILLGVERAAHAHGYFVSIASLESLDPGSVRSAVERLERQNVDGILLNSAQGGIAHELGEASTSVPLVALEDEASSTIPVVSVDQLAGASAATRCCSTSATAPCGTSPARPTGSPDAAAWRAGARRSTTPARSFRHRCSATGAPARATSSAGGSPPTPRSRRPSSPTTRWRWVCCARCASRGVTYSATSASSASTTSRRRAT